MRASDFRPANTYAMRYGAKTLCYGKPGVGKTPVASTAPRPLLVITEPGLLSMRNSTIPAIDCLTAERIAEFFAWLTKSPEVNNYDTIIIDSVSQMCELILIKAQRENKDGRAAYGVLSKVTMEYLNALYFLQQKHTYLICKQMLQDHNGVKVAAPYFPGQDLPVKIPHLYDVIINLDFHHVPGVGSQRAFRCQPGYGYVTRDRSGNLNEFEPPHLAQLFTKIMR